MPAAVPHIAELPYRADSGDWFEQLRHWPMPFWLDSGRPFGERGRWDLLGASPVRVHTDHGRPDDAPGDAAHRLLCALRDDLASLTPLSAPFPELPFCGGGVFSIGYDDAGEAGFCSSAGVYLWTLLVDHEAGRSWLLARPELGEARFRELRRRLRRPAPAAAPGPPFRLGSALDCNLGPEGYRKAFDRVQDYLRAGDCYQINLSRRFSAPCSGDPWPIYRELRGIAAAPFSAYLETPWHTLMSFSPERFLQCRDGELLTQPIKGTAARADDSAVDIARARELQASDKNRAENLMIVDLLRNDLGRVCSTGSVQVRQLFELQSFATVHHLVSSVSGRLAADLHAVDAFAACFPGGSITGAPKRRAMAIIRELEPDPRQIFCGSIGWLSPEGDLDSSIAIRTLLCRDGKLHAWAGGGIVADSDATAEFAETELKIRRLLDALPGTGG